MKLKKAILCVIICTAAIGSVFARGEGFFGQKAPGKIPEIFAPGLISSDQMEFYLSFTGQMDMMIFCRVDRRNRRAPSQILYMKKTGKQWSKPKPISYKVQKGNGYFFFAPFGKDIYFSSRNPVRGRQYGKNIRKLWKLPFSGQAWKKPVPVDLCLDNEMDVGHVTFTEDRSAYFYSRSLTSAKDEADIFSARPGKNNQYKNIEALKGALNTVANECDPFVDPKGQYVLLATSQHPKSKGDFDLFVSFKMKSGLWTEAINLDNPINTSSRELYPRVSPDGRYLFFSSNRSGNWEIYWVDAGIIDKLHQSYLSRTRGQ